MTEWFVVLYEWQGAQDMCNCPDWHPSAQIFETVKGANFEIEILRKGDQPRPGRITTRNIRGPFPWSEPTVPNTRGVEK